MGCWHGYLFGSRCSRAYGPADATATHCLASVKFRLFLPIWCRLTWVVPEKGPLNGCLQKIANKPVCVCCTGQQSSGSIRGGTSPTATSSVDVTSDRQFAIICSEKQARVCRRLISFSICLFDHDREVPLCEFM